MAKKNGALIAIETCGCVTAVLVSGFMSPQEEAEHVEGWLREGRKAEATSVKRAKERLTCECSHGRNARPDERSIPFDAAQLVREARS